MQKDFFKRNIIVKNTINLIYHLSVYMFFILMAGNILYFIPIIGDVSTSFSGSLIHIWIIVAIILFAISIIRLIKIKNKTSILNFGISMLSLALCIYIMVKLISALNSQGANIRLLKSYIKEDVSTIKTETTQFSDENNQNLPIEIYYENKDNPLIIYIHGGGWISGTVKDNEYTMKVLAKNGYTVASIGYELSTAEKHLWNKVESQLLLGITEICEKQKNIYMIGDSAGGNLVLDIAYKINAGIYKSINGKDLPKVKAVSVNYPVTNPKDFYNNDNFMAKNVSKKMTTYFFGGTPVEFSERYDEIMPEKYIGTNTPPTAVIVGENDPLVPPQSTYSFIEKLKVKGIKNRLIKAPYFGHAGDAHKNNLFNQAYINMTLDWIKKTI